MRRLLRHCCCCCCSCSSSCSSSCCSCSLLLLLQLLLLPHAILALSPDGLALLAFKSAVSDDPSAYLSEWAEDGGAADPCHWPGVTCANVSGFNFPRVVVVAVAGKNLSGYIPSELGTLLFLRRLNLHGNRLAGTIPAALSSASSLHSLFLHDNNLTGPLPAALCDLPRLRNLDLSKNNLSGRLPADLRNCRQLQRMLLSQNRLTGEIPAGIWPEMVDLVQLDISSNQFNGSLPPDLGSLSSLAGTLNLSRNRFSGEIPPSLGSLPSTVTLDLRYNALSGEIPQAGTLASQDPTAFLNNPGLCGFPLQIPCQDRSLSTTSPPPASLLSPSEASPEKKGLKTSLIILISISDAAGVALIGVIAIYIYWKVRDRESTGCSCTGNQKLGSGGGRGWCAWCCSGSEGNDDDDDDDEDEELEDEGGEEEEGKVGRLVGLEKGFEMELDELLRASAYVLGKGEKGIVYKVVVGNGTAVAVRRIGGGGGRHKDFKGEVEAIGKVRHPNVVRTRAYYWARDEKLLITDFVSNGNLAAALRGRSGQPGLSWSTRLMIAKGVARGLAHIHESSPRKFLHGDVKPSNILLDADYNPYICDFGLNRLMAIAGTDDISSSVEGGGGGGGGGGFIGSALPSTKSGPIDRPNNYRAPEARIPGSRPIQKWDVYSFGLVLLELLTGKQPELPSPSSATASSSSFDHMPEIVRWVRKGFEDARPISEILDPALVREVHAKKEVIAAFRIALSCTEADPDRRPRMKAVSENLDKVGP